MFETHFYQFKNSFTEFKVPSLPTQQRRLLSDWSVQSGISLVNPLKSKRGKETARFVTHRWLFFLFQASSLFNAASSFRTPCHLNIQFFGLIQFFNAFALIDLKWSPDHKLLIDILTRNCLDDENFFCLVRKVICSRIISKTFWVATQSNAVK